MRSSLKRAVWPTCTGDRQIFGIGLPELQQLRQGSTPDVKQSGPDRCFDTFQIESASRLSVAENDAKQLFYFAGDFLPDDFRSFFSWTD